MLLREATTNYQLPLTDLFFREAADKMGAKPQESHKMLSNPQVRQYLGETLAAILDKTFGKMEIAEEEIKHAQKRYPHKATLLYHAFSYIRPNELLYPDTEHIYRAHVRELLNRLGNDDKLNVVEDLEKFAGHRKRLLQPATDAELCCTFCNTSLATPLHGDAAAAYGKLFCKLYPKHADFWDGINESYTGAADNLINELRWKYRQPRTSEEEKTSR